MIAITGASGKLGSLVLEKLLAKVPASQLVAIVRNPEKVATPYQLVMSVYFESSAKLQAAMRSKEWQQVLADVPNYFGGVPDVLVGEIVTPGGPR